MGGLAKICRIYGSIKVQAANGKKATWVWDEATGKLKAKKKKAKKKKAKKKRATLDFVHLTKEQVEAGRSSAYKYVM